MGAFLMYKNQISCNDWTDRLSYILVVIVFVFGTFGAVPAIADDEIIQEQVSASEIINDSNSTIDEESAVESSIVPEKDTGTLSETDAQTFEQSVNEVGAQDARIGSRQITNINQGWTFDAGTNDFTGWDFPLGGSTGSIDLPHSWEYVHPTMSYIPTMNKKTVTYSKQLDVSSYQGGGRLFVKFYGVSRNSNVYIDREFVGSHVGGYSAFAIDVTDAVRGKKSVVLTVKVSNIDIDSIPINVDYTQWAGIYRDVELIATSDQYFSTEDYGSCGLYIDSKVIGTSGDITVRTKLSNAGNLDSALVIDTVIKDAAGNVIAQNNSPITLNANTLNAQNKESLSIPQVHLWNGVQDPYLYTVECTLRDSNETVLDSVSSTFGVRTFTVSNGIAYLNGKAIEIHGVGYHQDREGRGNAVTREQMQQDIDTMLDMGVNAVRTSHYPHDRAFYEMADKAGLLIYNEIPYYMIFSKAESYGDSITNQLKEMIRQGYNYPSIVMWGVQNEVNHNPAYASYGTDFKISESDLVSFNKKLVDLAHKEDSNRLIVQGVIDLDDRAVQTAKWSSKIDLSGVNLYVGFKSSVDHADDAGRKDLKKKIGSRIDAYKKIFGTTSMMISEYGAGANINQHHELGSGFSWDGNSDSSGSSHYEEYQSYVLECYWDEISHRSDVAASFVWNMFDFSCYRNEGGMSRRNTKGLVTYDHATKKDAYYFFKANWNQSDKFVYLTSKRYLKRVQQTQKIKAYSNCESVELFVNGVSFGSGRKQQAGVFVWDNVDLSNATSSSLKVVAQSGSDSYEDSVDGVTVPTAKLSAEAHVANIGWQAPVSSGAVIGTTGKALALEALRIGISDSVYHGGIQVSAHVSEIGWQQWANGYGGTTGRALPMEAVRLRLTGDFSNQYDIYYRAHAANFGWLSWAKNGEPVGTQGFATQLEAVEIVLVFKGEAAPGTTTNAFKRKVQKDELSYTAHVANIGWQQSVTGPGLSGTMGRNLQMEALKVSIGNLPLAGGVELSSHIQDIGWQGWRVTETGTTGQAKRMEAVKIKLMGEVGELYDVYYRAHIADYGWLSWAKNGEPAGSEGHAKSLQAVEIKLVPKGQAFTDDTSKAFIN